MFSDTGIDGKVITARLGIKYQSPTTPNTHKYILLTKLTSLMFLFKFMNVIRQ